MGPPRKIGKTYTFLGFVSVHGKIAWDGPKWGREYFFPANPDLADILGRTDFDVDNFYFLDLLVPKFPDFQVQISQNLPLGRAGPLDH